LIYASAAVNWLKEKVNQFPAARSWHSARAVASRAVIGNSFIKLRIQMSSSKIIDHRFFIRLDLDHSLKANSQFLTNQQNRENIANQLLIYDEIIIPTKDYGIIPILINWFGLDSFLMELEHNTFSFLHTNSLLGYAGNGVGISGFTIEEQGKPFEWWQDAMFRDSSIAIEQQLKNMCSFISKETRNNIVSTILKRTKEVEYDNDFFMKNIVHETYYNDIKGNKDLYESVVAEVLKGQNGAIFLERLPGINSNELRVLNQEGKIQNSIDLVLRIAEINMELFMASISDDADLFTSDGAEKLLEKKLIRSGISENLLKGCLSILELRNIPSIGKAVAQGEISFEDLLKIRQNNNSVKFRSWLRNNDSKDPEELKKLYVDSLEKKLWIETLPGKSLRFAITTGIGVINPPVGLVISVIDNFYLERWMKGYSPKIFLDEISKLKT
jgi:hypothetical protein